MDEHEENFKDIFRYTDVEYTPDGYSDVYRWDDFLGIAGGHVYSAMDTIDSVSPGGEYEGDEPEHAYACEIVACCGLSDGVALFRPVSHDGADLIQVAFLRNDVDDATGAYTERFEAGSFDLPAADFPRSESGVDLLEYFSGRSFKHTPGVSRGLDPREAVDSIEDAIGCDLGGAVGRVVVVDVDGRLGKLAAEVIDDLADSQGLVIAGNDDRNTVSNHCLRSLFDIQIDTRRVAGRVRGPRNGDKTVTGIHNLSICNIGRQAEQVLIVDKCCACPIPAAADNHKLVYLGLRSAILNNGHKSAPSRLCFPVS